MTDREGGAKSAGKAAPGNRAARLGDALRANLRRRKDQDRGRAATPPQSPDIAEASRNERDPRNEDR